MYSLAKVLKILKKNFLLYTLILLQIIVGMSMISYAINFKYNLDDLEDDIKRMKYGDYIEIFASDNEDESSNVITIDDYKGISKIFKKNISYIIRISDTSVYKGNIVSYNIVCTDFKKINLNPNKIYCPRKISDYIKSSNEVSDMDFSKYTPVNDYRINFDDLGIAKNDKTFLTREEVEESVLVDIDKYKEVAKNKENLPLSVLMIDKNASKKEKSMIVGYLKSKHDESSSVVVTSRSGELELAFYTSRVNANMIRNIGILMMVPLLVSLGTIYRKIVGYRKKEMGVSLVSGANYMNLYMELFLEMFIVFFIASLISTTLATLALCKLVHVSSGLINISIDYRILILPIVVTILTSVLFSLIAFYDISKKSIIELINSK